MPYHVVQCHNGHKHEIKFRVNDDMESLLSHTKCPECDAVGVSIDFSEIKQGKPTLRFVPGVYHVGTAVGGKYYSTDREMRNDVARHGLTLRRA